MNQLIVRAAASKVSALTTAEVFAEHRARADRDLFLRILNCPDGLPPRPDDVIPEDLVERPKAGETAGG